jgi:hypothetical protein
VFKINGTDYSSLITSTGAIGWVSITGITSITSIFYGVTSGGGEKSSISAIEVDGKFLVDAGVSITTPSIASEVRANPSAGFSIIKAPIGSSGGTIGTGLNASPGMLIVKNIGTNGTNWVVWHSSLGTNDYLLLNSTAAKATSSSLFNGVSNSTFTVGSGFASSTQDFICYAFAPVNSYSAMGSYVGNGGSQFVYLGFRPKWILFKNVTQANSWFIMDAARNPFNVADKLIHADAVTAETTYGWIDFVSNGFQILNTATGVNNSGIQNLYIAFAEHPFKTARAR